MNSQQEGTPIRPLDRGEAHGQRGVRRSARRPGRQPSPTRSWKNSREFDDEKGVRNNNDTPIDLQRRDGKRTSYHQQEQRQGFHPTSTPSPAAKLKPSTHRSTSYTHPLPLFTEESKPKSAPAPLTEHNLRSLLRSLDSSPNPEFSESGRKATGFGNNPSAPAPGVSATTAAALGKTGSGRAQAQAQAASGHRPAPPTVTPTVPVTGQDSASMRKSKSPTKSPKKQNKDKEKKKSKYDSDIHPLNLPPDQLRQHLAQMARQEAESAGRMSMDRDIPEANNNDSSSLNSTGGTSLPSTPSKEAPGAFPGPSTDDDAANGTNGHLDERSPTPPPHKVAPAPKVDPEACKAAGNKYFKAKDYERAIQEYTKGASKSEQHI